MPDDPPAPDPSPPSRPPPTDEPDDLAKLRRENASRRKHERELEGQLEGALAHIAKVDNREVERSASAHGFRSAEDVRLFLGDRSHLTGDDGHLDPAKLDQALTSLAESRPYLLAEPEPPDNGHPDLHGGARQSVPRPPSFGDMLKDA